MTLNELLFASQGQSCSVTFILAIRHSAQFIAIVHYWTLQLLFQLLLESLFDLSVKAHLLTLNDQNETWQHCSLSRLSLDLVSPFRFFGQHKGDDDQERSVALDHHGSDDRPLRQGCNKGVSDTCNTVTFSDCQSTLKAR